MMDFDHTSPEDILRAYVIERRRLASGVSSSGLDENGRMPSLAASRHWEMLLLLVKRVPQEALEALELRWCGYKVDVRASKARKSPVAESEWRSCMELPTGWSVEEYAAAAALDEDRPNMIQTFAGEFPILLGNREIGRAMGITATEVKGIVAEAVLTVRENLAKMKGGGE